MQDKGREGTKHNTTMVLKRKVEKVRINTKGVQEKGREGAKHDKGEHEKGR